MPLDRQRRRDVDGFLAKGAPGIRRKTTAASHFSLSTLTLCLLLWLLRGVHGGLLEIGALRGFSAGKQSERILGATPTVASRPAVEPMSPKRSVNERLPPRNSEGPTAHNRDHRPLAPSSTATSAHRDTLERDPQRHANFPLTSDEKNFLNFLAPQLVKMWLEEQDESPPRNSPP